MYNKGSLLVCYEDMEEANDVYGSSSQVHDGSLMLKGRVLRT